MHVSIAGRLSDAIERAERLRCDTIQIFSRSPRRWAMSPLDPAEAQRFRDRRKESGIDPLVVHSAYLINLAASDAALFDRSVRALSDELDRASELEADYLVVHVGSASQEAGPGPGRVIEALRRLGLSRRTGAKLLLENTAGERGDLGWCFEELAEVLEAVGGREGRIGVCLDTCHAFAAGYDLAAEDGIDRLAALVERTVGFDRIEVIHLNDSKGPLDCRVDRHWHIGEGKMGLATFRRLVHHSRFGRIPMILETPKDGEEDDIRNLGVVRRLAG